MRLPLLVILPLGTLALAGCDIARGAVETVVHPAADRYCAEVAPGMRAMTRASLGTTSEGNRIIVDCVHDADPDAPR